MKSDHATGRAIADEASTKGSIENSAVHLEIDGTMDLSSFSPPRQPTLSGPDDQIEPSRTANEAELRRVIRLQRQALNKQGLRIEQQRALITRLNHSLKQMHLLAQKHSVTSWLRSLLSRKNGSEESNSNRDRSIR